MKIITQILKLIACLVFFVGYLIGFAQQSEPVDRLIDIFKNPDKHSNYVMIRGEYWKDAPENSLDAIQYAIDLKCDMVEIDVMKSTDGVFFLFHDWHLGRLTNGTGLGKGFEWKSSGKLQSDQTTKAQKPVWNPDRSGDSDTRRSIGTV